MVLPENCTKEVRRPGLRKMNAPSDIRRRRAESRDAPAIALLLSEAFAEYRILYTSAGYEATAIADQQVITRIKEGPVWIAMLDGLVVGTVSVVPKPAATIATVTHFEGNEVRANQIYGGKRIRVNGTVNLI